MKNHKLMLNFKHFSLQILNKDLNEKVSIKEEVNFILQRTTTYDVLFVVAWGLQKFGDNLSFIWIIDPSNFLLHFLTLSLRVSLT